MKILALNNPISFKNNDFSKILPQNMFQSGMITPLNQLERDIFVKGQQEEQKQGVVLKNIDDQAFNLAFSHIQDIDPDAQALWKLNFALSFYIELVHDHMSRMKNADATLEFFDSFTMDIFNSETSKSMKHYLEKSYITDMDVLYEVAQVYTATRTKYKQVQEKGLDFIFACAFLNENKFELGNFPNIFMQAARNTLYLNEDHNMYDYGYFVRDLGIKNENAFFKKFAHLAPTFNNFEDTDDKLAAFEYVYKTYPVKEFALEEIISINPDVKGQDVCKLYMEHCDIVDYLYEENDSNWIIKINNILSQCAGQEKLSSQAQEAFSELINAKTPQGKIELYDFLSFEGISINELNFLAKSNDYQDIEPLELVINRNAIIENLLLLEDFDEEKAKEFYLNFHQALNAIFDENDAKQSDKFKNLIRLIDEFEIKNDKELIKLYSNIESVSSKQSKGKKAQSISRKPKAQSVAEFIDLFAFANDDSIKKYKKDKYYPLKQELLKRKAQFEKLKPQIEKEIARKDKAHILNGAMEVYLLNDARFKVFPNAAVALDVALKIKEEQKALNDSYFQTYNAFLKYFDSEEMLQEFFAKNNIVIDETKENQVHCETCLRILGDIFDDKNEKERKVTLEKLMKNDFISNAGMSIVKFARKKDDMELEILFDVILNENINSLAQINTILNKYKGKNGAISSFLLNFKNYGFTFGQYVKILENIQKEFDKSGIPITINNDNIFDIDLDEYADVKNNGSEIALLAKNILNSFGNGNFILGLSASTARENKHISADMIAKEILLSKSGRYSEEYSNLIREFNIDEKSLKSQLSNKDMVMIGKSAIDRKLVELLNSLEWQKVYDETNEVYNLSLHAKMRLLDRFIFNEPNSSELSVDEINKKLKEILNIVYLQNPTKVQKSSKDNSFVAYYDYGSDEIKAVFEKNGQMLTIIKK